MFWGLFHPWRLDRIGENGGTPRENGGLAILNQKGRLRQHPCADSSSLCDRSDRDRDDMVVKTPVSA